MICFLSVVEDHATILIFDKIALLLILLYFYPRVKGKPLQFYIEYVASRIPVLLEQSLLTTSLLPCREMAVMWPFLGAKQCLTHAGTKLRSSEKLCRFFFKHYFGGNVTPAVLCNHFFENPR